MAEKIKVLVVDDNRDFCENIKDILEMEDCDVDISETGKEGLEMVMNKVYHLVLMDVKMPVMNGVSSTKEILHIDPTIRILFISADETIRTEALECGALDFLTKPIRSVQLFEALDKHLGN